MADPVARDLRLALFGCGRMGRTRADLVDRFGGRIAYAFDTDRSAAERTGAEVLASPEALDLGAIDALFVCTPPGSRGEVELEALRRGLAVFVEKPLAVDTAAAERWAAAARSGGGVTSVGYMNRYRPSVLRAAEVARREGVVGLSAYWASGKYARTWWQDPQLSGGPLNEQMTHLVDLMRTVGGEVHATAAVGVAADPPITPERATDAAVAVAFAGGHIGTISYSCRAASKGIGLVLLTPERTVKLDGWDFRDADSLTDEDPFRDETEAFLRAVASGSAPRPRVDVAEAVRTQRVVDAVKQSLRTGRRVEA